MSDRLEKALKFANYRHTLNNQRIQLKAKNKTLLTYSFGGGTFFIDRSLISFVDMLIKDGEESVVLLDQYELPILVEDLQAFKEEILGRYFESTNEYHADYTKLRQSRSVDKLLDLDLDE